MNWSQWQHTLMAPPLIWGENTITLSIFRCPGYPQLFKMQRPLETVQNLMKHEITEINHSKLSPSWQHYPHQKQFLTLLDVGTVYEICHCWRVSLSLLWLMPQLEDWSWKSPIFPLQNTRYCSLKGDSPYILLWCVTMGCTPSCHFKRC